MTTPPRWLSRLALGSTARRPIISSSSACTPRPGYPLYFSINRLAAVLVPHHYHKFTTRKAVAVMVTLPWCLGLGGNLPLWFGVGARFSQRQRYPICSIQPKKNDWFTTGWNALGAYIPIGILGGVYGMLLLRLLVFRTNRVTTNNRPPIISGQVLASGLPSLPIRPGHAPATNTQSRTRQLALTKMLLLSFVWYAICLLITPVFNAILPGAFSSTQSLAISMWLSRTVVSCGLSASPVIVCHIMMPPFVTRVADEANVF